MINNIMAKIDRDKKYLFIHIPRTGGTSIEVALNGFRSAHPMPIDYIEGRHESGIKGEGLGEEGYKEYFKFTFVRNPWDQIVSLYHFYTSGSEMYKRDYYKGVSFTEYVRLTHGQITRWERKIQQQREEGVLPKYPTRVYPCEIQWIWYTDFMGNLLVDYIGQFETIEKDFKLICDHIGIDVKLPHVNIANSRKNKEYRDHFTDETRYLVEEYAWREIQMFGYSF